MPALRVKQNAVFRALDDYMIEEHRPIECRLRDGDYRAMSWAGFVTSDQVVAMEGRKVKLKVFEYTEGDRFSGWKKIPPGQHVLGCIIKGKAHGVLHNDQLVIIP